MTTVPNKKLNLFDSVCIIVGTIIGVGIFTTPPFVARHIVSWTGFLGIWLAGGFIALIGALGYAELATTYPQQGGDYVYLNRAFGRWAGYLFVWFQLVLIRPCVIATMSFIFANYAQTLYAPFPDSRQFYAVVAITVFTFVNILGVIPSKWIQNILTLFKVLGIGGIIVVGLGAPEQNPIVPQVKSVGWEGFGKAFVFVMFNFLGWQNIAYVAAEVKRPRKNIIRALVIGMFSVMVLYLFINWAYLSALGIVNLPKSEAVAVDTIRIILPKLASQSIAVLICISALGAVNGLIFSGARVSHALGTDYPAFHRLGKLHDRFATPVWALMVQGGLSLAMVSLSESFIGAILYFLPVFWLFMIATTLSIFVLRYREPQIYRPYKMTGYPLTPILFCCCCIYILYSVCVIAFEQKPISLIFSIAILLLGILTYLFVRYRKC